MVFVACLPKIDYNVFKMCPHGTSGRFRCGAHYHISGVSSRGQGETVRFSCVSVENPEHEGVHNDPIIISISGVSSAKKGEMALVRREFHS